MAALRVLATVAGLVTCFGWSSAADAYSIFFGEDLNSSSFVPLASFPNASAAEADFLSNLVGVGTEDFESFASGTGAPLNLTFPGAGSATLTGGGGSIVSVAPGTASAGRYGTSGSKFWEVAAGGANSFQVTFGAEVAAFGFFGVDVGDFGGQIELELANGSSTTLNIPSTVGSFGSTDGSVLFFGIIAENAGEQFTSASFLTSTGQGDIFAFDDFTVGSLEQVQPPTNPVPEPGAALIFGSAILLVSRAGRSRA